MTYEAEMWYVAVIDDIDFQCGIRELKQTNVAAERRRSHSNLH